MLSGGGGLKREPRLLVIFFIINLYVFLFFSILDPVGIIFDLKTIGFLGALTLTFFLYVFAPYLLLSYRTLIGLILFTVVVPLYGYTVANLSGFEIDFVIAHQYSYAFLPFLLIIPLASLKLKIDNILSSILIFQASLILVISMFSLLGSDYYILFGDFFDRYLNAAKIGMRDFNGLVVPMVYFKASVLLVFLMAYGSLMGGYRGWLITLLGATAMVLSGTRANAIVAVITLLLFILIKVWSKNRALAVLFLILGLCFVGFLSIMLASHFFVSTEASNHIKLGHLDGYMDYFFGSGLQVIFGAGTGSGFYSPGYGKIVYASELSYLELFRIYGVFGMVILSVFVLPAFYRKSLGIHYFIAWLGFLMIASSNPLLISSTGMIALLYIYSIMYGCDSHDSLVDGDRIRYGN